MRRLAGLVALLVLAAPLLAGDEKSLESRIKELESDVEKLSFQLDQVRKSTDDVLWFLRMSDAAEVDKVALTGPGNPRGTERYGIANDRHPFRIYQYVFVPLKLDKSKKHPVVILPHGGVHGDFGTYHVHIVREMLAKGWIVLAPEYRGSTGYGKDFNKAIDYGGLEIDDVIACRDWAIEQLPFADGSRVAIAGWSHGGLIALLSVLHHPEKFKVAYAGVPVTDLVARLGYHEQSYEDEFAAKNHIGKKVVEDVDEYRKRSPVFHAAKLKTPLLVHATTNDRDVHVLETENLVAALKAADRRFEYKIYKDAPGGHGFNRIDTLLARESRREIWAFLEKHLGK
ncbi:MAG: alpha/beta fold hydrolase [Thermoanaerobaculia bacterium]|nr:alpha/beta fold hydrolase [Thermoanaerobaculia bacterium]